MSDSTRPTTSLADQGNELRERAYQLREALPQQIGREAARIGIAQDRAAREATLADRGAAAAEQQVAREQKVYDAAQAEIDTLVKTLIKHEEAGRSDEAQELREHLSMVIKRAETAQARREAAAEQATQLRVEQARAIGEVNAMDAAMKANETMAARAEAALDELENKADLLVRAEVFEQLAKFNDIVVADPDVDPDELDEHRRLRDENRNLSRDLIDEANSIIVSESALAYIDTALAAAATPTTDTTGTADPTGDDFDDDPDIIEMHPDDLDDDPDIIEMDPVYVGNDPELLAAQGATDAGRSPSAIDLEDLIHPDQDTAPPPRIVGLPTPGEGQKLLDRAAALREELPEHFGREASRLGLERDEAARKAYASTEAAVIAESQASAMGAELDAARATITTARAEVARLRAAGDDDGAREAAEAVAQAQQRAVALSARIDHAVEDGLRLRAESASLSARVGELDQELVANEARAARAEAAIDSMETKGALLVEAEEYSEMSIDALARWTEIEDPGEADQAYQDHHDHAARSWEAERKAHLITVNEPALTYLPVAATGFAPIDRAQETIGLTGIIPDDTYTDELVDPSLLDVDLDADDDADDDTADDDGDDVEIIDLDDIDDDGDTFEIDADPSPDPSAGFEDDIDTAASHTDSYVEEAVDEVAYQPAAEPADYGDDVVG